jgi:hypothetical protein
MTTATRYEPGVEYLYSPSQDLVVPWQPLLLKMNTHNGDWCSFVVDAPDPVLVTEAAVLELRKLSYRPGHTEAELQEACKNAPVEAIDLARQNAYYKVIESSITQAKSRAMAKGKIPVQKEDIADAMKRSVRAKSASTIDLSKPIPDADPAPARAAVVAGVKK